MRLFQIVALVLPITVGLAACTPSDRSSPPTDVKLENLLQSKLADEFAADREVIISRVEIPPDTMLERHWHPGEEFYYILEGKATLVANGDSITSTGGTAGKVPYQAMHTAVTGEEGASVVVFRVHAEGEPVRYLEDGGASEE